MICQDKLKASIVNLDYIANIPLTVAAFKKGKKVVNFAMIFI